ncbi:hypothetical protein J512_4032 [Acinetobacter baumannii 1295743]|uniref:Uncharacterized protein n=1 Tax=Acinetobacter baumannii (strain 1295743) TaxID=1310613 RepID=A0A009II05_ACIB9|nr:hypothetical protein J512_4032 [Acinetobacter baumannii 1295743]
MSNQDRNGVPKSILNFHKNLRAVNKHQVHPVLFDEKKEDN